MNCTSHVLTNAKWGSARFWSCNNYKHSAKVNGDIILTDIINPLDFAILLNHVLFICALTLTKSCLTPEFSMYTPIFGSEDGGEKKKSNTNIYSLTCNQKHK